ncbi:sensor histidine kinase [Dokdonella immobilis]|uniref:histidine kinase n=1 Tax=Dokdonella immobilis TaxID=578942 RepID=A0A1I5A6N3_9GAMM|nr:ATP-binding protein [Dokdonella immobilis]SFN58113.1 two-component system, OmpR family, sensor histidine kinase KdpD [Dokdonella immobilis]
MHDEPANPRPAAGYALAALASLLAVLVAAVAERLIGLDDLSLVFMLAVLVVASRTRSGPAVLTAMLCFLAYNFFFIEPRYTLYISARHGTTTVVLFLAAALLAGRLASRLAMQVRELGSINRDASVRQVLARRLAEASSEDEIVQVANSVFEESLGVRIHVSLDHEEPRESGAAADSRERSQPPADRAAASDCRNAGQDEGFLLELRSIKGRLGEIALESPLHATNANPSRQRLLRSMADDIAGALLRARLVADLQAERIANETERLRSALLASVSHDLRTPLASIIGAAESLQSFQATLSASDRDELLHTVRTEGERLNRYIQNLLDMTRLGHGALALRRDWIGVDELVGSAIARLRRYRPDAHFETTIGRDLEPVWVHPALVEQALFNVLENAAEFSPPGEPVTVDARLADACLRIEIGDLGPGIPEAERERVFKAFYSARRGESGRSGTGLGLTICRGMIGAHGGRVEALPGTGGRGTRIRIEIPADSRPAPSE